MKSSFRLKITEIAIYVIDCDGLMSVTNDAENVVEYVVRYAVIQKGEEGLNLPIYYRDSEGDWSELIHEGEGFIGFGMDPIDEVFYEEINRL